VKELDKDINKALCMKYVLRSAKKLARFISRKDFLYEKFQKIVVCSEGGSGPFFVEVRSVRILLA